MSPSNSIANRLREVFFNGLWIANTNYKKELSNLSWEQAVFKVEDLNTVAALTFHINYYLNGILKAIESGSLDIRDKYSFDLLPVLCESDWHKLVAELLNNAEKLSVFLEHSSPEKLNDIFFEEKYGTWQRNMEGLIEHSYYHLGQITLIVKMLNNKRQQIKN